ncbi:MAG: phenylacetic acid degradation bifunctional protein PaaZ, partial [Halobacteriovoraceae bacterium]|nr:phenylacetic acid degradation bifunctional protein PaaZ [Halobacteriovoraceae bacterium]
MKLMNYCMGSWQEGQGEGVELHDAVYGKVVATATSDGIDFGEMLNYARSTGIKNLQKLTFHERARALKALALYLIEKKNDFYKISFQTGATKIDSWIDIEGGIGNLFAMSSKGRRELPDDILFVDGNPEVLSKNGTFIGHHIYTSKKGAAIHINAFNFPVWGMLEKIAVNLLAGVPAVVKPATSTSYLTEAVVKEIVASKILPEGSLQLICGSARTLLDHAQSQDVVTFTGSASTGQMLKANKNIIENAVPFNMEADSLNCSILCPKAAPGSEEFDLFVKEVSKEMTIKAGQKCTAIRRAIVPENRIEEVAEAIKKRLDKVVIGDPTEETVRMGALASRDQLKEVQDKIALLRKSCDLLYSKEDFNLVGGDKDKGAFMAPTLLLSKDKNASEPHNIEAFGPVSTLIGYSNVEEAIQLANRGEGSLVASVVTHDPHFAREMAVGIGSHHGRLYFLDRSSAKEGTGHGSPLPQLVHGGPGRAGGGEEMGGLRGVKHYMQRTAIQGHPTTLTKITRVFQPGAERVESEKHPFRYHFEELEIGQTLTTHKRTITEADIVNFANVSWDHFYAHTDDTSFDGELFEKRVAHGYFIISAAAGLFVDPGKGPVLANYGLDELRFTKPVYVGATMKVKLTCKEKIDQENKPDQTP